VAIARALAKEAQILLADEPTGNLDSKSGETVISTLYHSTRKLGTTTVVATHDLSITRTAERVVRLRDGVIVEDTRKPSKAS